MAQTKEERTQYGIAYRKNHVRQIKLDLSIEHDADILAFLDSLPNRTGYLKQLIRSAIEHEKNKGETKMKKSEVIKRYYGDIRDAMVERYRTVLECSGSVQYKIYVWEDGEIECQEGPQGDNAYLAPRSGEPRDLYYIGTIAAPYFDPWDLSDHAAPDDEDERETERREIIDWAVDEYRESGADALIDAAIDAAEQDESEIP